ncbi:aspartyl-tRNA amidotransferase [Erysipelothrix larvae]|uniref:Aspartyl-tRNA amidotransferase n=1 Tax=Erysipelothrix larvae TaxID=1514105 RepID=A0A0X8GYA5_9FIRM|nr:amidase family protein [Erysipelothrix larvae]AMC92646.1 aspartyl-tRNA amidotransferase [Erysipelothrix larvae]
MSEAVISKIKEHDASLNAVVSYIDNFEPLPTGPLKGWSVALKDNFNMKGTLTTASCNLLSNYTSIYDSHVVQLLKLSGADLVVKTSMDELGMGGTNLSALTGPVHNPYDYDRISGGSSGGSAALAGKHLVRLALGSDTGDSVRKPAAYCGTIGVKPTYGRISRYGVIPYASSLDHVGYFVNTIEDAAQTLEVLAGRDDRDMTSSFESVPEYSKLLDMDLQGKRIGIFKDVMDAITDPQALALFESFKKDLEEKGAILIEKHMSRELLVTILPVYYTISTCEAVANHANLDGLRFGLTQEGDSLEALMTNTRTNGFSTNIKKRFIFGAFGLDDANQEEIFNKAKRIRRLIVDAYSAMISDVDVMVCLATSTVAPLISGSEVDELSDQNLIAENHMIINNFTGFPSLTQPIGKVDGMPFGINVSAKAFDEQTLFAYAHQFESIIGWEGDFKDEL